jgi:MFS family permease
MKKYPATVWFVTVFTMFFGRGFLYSSWSSRGPEVQERLGITIADMGILATLFAAGAIVGVLGSGKLVALRGSRVLAIMTFAGMPSAMALAIVGVAIGSFPLTAFALFVYGLPFGAADFVSNVEGSELDRNSTKSRLPMLHGGYSIGVLAGALFTSVLIVANVPLEVQVGITLLAVGAFAVYRVSGIPANHGKPIHDVSEASDVRPKLTSAAKKRVSLISSIAFIFVLAEGAAAIFIPLALVEAGRTPAEAAFAYTLFSLGMAVSRIVGGRIVDRFGRATVVLYSAVLAAVGVGLFSLTQFGPFELVGALLWGIGNSLPIAMAVSATTDNQKTASRSQSILWTWVYFGNLGVGPILGGASAVIGIFGAFLIPVALLVYSATVSGVTKPDPEVSRT